MKKNIWIGLLSALILVGCANEESFDSLFETVKLEASIDNSNSRVAFDADGNFLWTINDAIGVTTTGSKNSFSKMNINEGGIGKSKATFIGKYMSGTPEGYAVYPYNMSHKLDGTELTYNFPVSYDYKIEDHDYFVSDGTGNSFNPPMWSTISDGKVHFKHLGGVFCVKIANLPAGQNQQLKLIASNRITGNFTADLSSASPALITEASEENNVVTINYSNSEESTRVFYVPVPTGTYESLVVEFEADGETVRVPFANKEVNPRQLKRLQIGEGSIEGGEDNSKEVTSIDGITDNVLSTDKEDLSIKVTGEVSGDNTITIPATLQTETTTFSFVSIAEGAIIKINEETESSYNGQIIIEVPEGTATSQIEAYVPNGEVYIKQGNVTTLIASSKQNTTIIGSGVTIETLIVKQGNVRIEDGAVVTSIQRQDNQDNVTYVIYEAAKAPEITLGEGVLLVSAAEFDLLTAIANGGEVTMTSDVALTTPIEIPNGKTVTIDLNGYTISQTKECTGSYSMITNKGTLTIKDGTTESNGKITFEDLSNGGGSVWGSYVITNNGMLVVENGTLEHLGSANPEDHNTNLPIQNYAGKVTINGGVISSKDFRSLRDFTAGGEIIINGGVFKGQVWMQGLGNGSSSLTINGGEFSPLQGYDGSSVYITNGTNDIIVSINGGKFNTKIGCADATKAGIKGSVKGGIFTELAKTNTNNALIAEGCAFVQTADGNWEIEKSWGQTSETSYTIYSAKGMKWLAEQVNSGQETFEGKTITLANDIDLNDEEWTPIGTFNYSFDGNFDGQNHVIKNLKITSSATGEVYIALFGVTANNKIGNFTIENVNISSEGQIVAAAVAYPYYTDVKNVTVKGDITIKGGNYTAGVLAYTRLCVNASNLTIVGNSGSSITGANTVGGVIPDIQMNNGLVANYSNFAASGLTISGTNAVGGISGIIGGQTLDGASVKNVTLSCEKQVGMISGSMGRSSILKNLTIENVTGASDVIGGNYDTAEPIQAKIGEQYYSLFSDAFAKVKNGETITLLTDITLNEGLTITEEQNLTIDLNGKTISQELAQTTAYAMITNKGTLTIMDSSNKQNGKISYADVTMYSADNNYASNTIHNAGTLTLKSGTIENVSSDNVMNFGYPHAIDAYPGSVTNIEGGTVKSVNYDCIRMFCNSTTLATTVNISGGNIINRVTFQNPSSNKAGYGVLNITGGKFTTTDNVNANVRLLNFSTDITKMSAEISGGTFDKGVKTQNHSASSIALTDWLTIENVTIPEIK